MNAQKCGKFIAELRKEKNLTQKDLATQLNVSDKAISRWETGKGFPDVDSLQALSKFFSVTINELLAGEKAEINMGIWLDYTDITNDYQDSVFAGTIKVYTETVE